jgi:hypothetical protein
MELRRIYEAVTSCFVLSWLIEYYCSFMVSSRRCWEIARLIITSFEQPCSVKCSGASTAHGPKRRSVLAASSKTGRHEEHVIINRFRYAFLGALNRLIGTEKRCHLSLVPSVCVCNDRHSASEQWVCGNLPGRRVVRSNTR